MDINNIINSNNSNNNNTENDKDANKIKVAIRVRPLNQREGDQKIPWIITKDTIGLSNNSNSNFIYDYVFGIESDTNDLYQSIAQNIVKSSLSGINGTIFAYGQTSSGKTYTMKTIIALSIKDIFHVISETSIDKEYLLKVSYLEIYNEEIKDLLNTSNKANADLKLKIYEDIYRGVVVANLKEEIVITPTQVFELIKFGEDKRHVGSTQMNDSSSRSHSIFRMQIQSTDKSNGSIQMSTLTLVDLAGSERISSTGAEGVRLREGTHINKSLMTLSKVISKLSDEKTQNQHISYRDSKLTRILQSSLGGNSRTAIICTITPAATHQEESISTLLFAKRAKKVKNNIKINQLTDANSMVKQYELQVLQLQDKLNKADEQNLKYRNLLNSQNITTPSKKQLQLHVTSNSTSSTPNHNNNNNNDDNDDSIVSSNFKLGIKRYNDSIKSLHQPFTQKKKRRNTFDPTCLKQLQQPQQRSRKSRGEITINGSDDDNSDIDEDDTTNSSLNDSITSSFIEENEIKPLDEETIKKILKIDDSMGVGGNVKVSKEDLDLIYEELEQNKQLINEYSETVELFQCKLQDKEKENQDLLEAIDQWEQECLDKEAENIENQLKYKESIDKLQSIHSDKQIEYQDTLQNDQDSIYRLNQLVDEKSMEISSSKESFNQILKFLEKSYQLASTMEDRHMDQIETFASSYFELETSYKSQLLLNELYQTRIESLNSDIEMFKSNWIPIKEEINNYHDANQMFKNYILELEDKYNSLIDLHNSGNGNGDSSSSNNTTSSTEQSLQITTLETSNRQLQTQLYNLLANASQSTQSLESQLQKSQEIIDKLNLEIKELTSSIDLLKNENQIVSNESLVKINNLESELQIALQDKERVEQIQQLELIITENKESIQQLLNQLQQNTIETNSIKQSSIEMESALQLAKEENEKLISQNSEFTTSFQQIKSMFNEIQSQKQTIELEYNNRLQSWSIDTNKYQEVIQCLENENQIKKQEITSTELQFTKLLTEYNQLFEKLNSVEKKSLESNESLQLLQSIEKTLQDEKQQLINRNNTLEQQLQVIAGKKDEELSIVQIELESKKSELLKLSCQFAQQTKQVTQLLVSVDESKSQLSERNEEINAFKLKSIEINAVKEENSNLKEQLSKLKKQPKSTTDREKDMQKKEMEKLKEKFNSIELKLKQITQDKSTLQSDKQSLEKEIKDLKRQHTLTDNELDKLKKTHLAADIKSKEFTTLNKQVETLSKSQESNKLIIQETEVELNKKKQELAKKVQEYDTLLVDRDEKEKKLLEIETNYQESIIKLENYENQFNQLTCEIIELKSKYESLENDKLESEKLYNEKLQESSISLGSITIEKNELTQQLSELQSSFEQFKSVQSIQQSKQLDKITLLEQSLTSRDKEYQLSLDKINSISDQLNLKTWEFNGLESQCNQLSTSLTNAKTEIELQENTITNLECSTTAKIKSLELELTNESDSHRIEVIELSRLNNQLSTKQKLLEQESIQLNERIIQLSHQKTKNESELLSLESTILDLQNKVVELTSANETISQEFEIERVYLKSLSSSTDSNLKSLSDQFEQSKLENQQLQSKLLKLELQSQQDNQQHQLQITELQCQLTNQKESYNNELQQLQVSFDQEKSKQLKQQQDNQDTQFKELQLKEDHEKSLLHSKIKSLEKELELAKLSTIQSQQETTIANQKIEFVAEQFKIKESEYLDTITDFVQKEREFERCKLTLKTNANRILSLQKTIKELQSTDNHANGNPVVNKPPTVTMMLNTALDQNGQPIKSILKKQNSSRIIIPPRDSSTTNSISASSTLTNSKSISNYFNKKSEQTSAVTTTSTITNNVDNNLVSSVIGDLPQNKKVRLVIKQDNNTPTNNLITTSTSLKSKQPPQQNKENLTANNNINNNNIK